MSQIEKIYQALTPQPPQVATESGDDWLDIQAFYRVIRRRIGMIVTIMGLILLAAVPLILTRERVYSASTRILVQEPLPSTLSASGLAADSKVNPITETERLLSRDIAVRVIGELGIQDLPEFNPELRPVTWLDANIDRLRELLSPPRKQPLSSSDPLRQILPEYLEHLTVWRNPNSDVINVGFTSKDAELAAAVPNTLLRAYLDERTRQAGLRAATAEGWLSSRIAEQEQSLAQAVAAVDAAKREGESQLRNSSGNAEVITTLDTSRIGNARAQADLRARITALREADGPEARADAADTEALSDLRRELDAERLNQARLLGRYGAEVTVVRDRISDLESKLAAEVDREERRMQARLLALQQEDAAFAQSLKSAQAALAEYRSIELQVERLQRVVDKERETLESIKGQLRAVRAETLLPSAAVEVLSPATTPLKADGRGRLHYLAVSLLGAVLIALTAAFLIEMTDRTVRSHDQLNALPSVRATGMVPAMSRRATRQFWRSPSAQNLDPLYGDAIQGILFELELGGSGTLPQNLLVTSALPGEGKTTFAVALATELAASGRQVLLVDADIRHGRLTDRLGKSGNPGFSDYLAGRVDLGALDQDEVADGISLIGRGTRGPARSFDRGLIRTLIRSANASQKVVVIDGTPVLVAHQAMLLAGVAARTILFIRWGQTDRRSVETAVERLSASSDQRIDAVIGRVNPRRQALYGYKDAGILARTARQYRTKPA